MSNLSNRLIDLINITTTRPEIIPSNEELVELTEWRSKCISLDTMNQSNIFLAPTYFDEPAGVHLYDSKYKYITKIRKAYFSDYKYLNEEFFVSFFLCSNYLENSFYCIIVHNNRIYLKLIFSVETTNISNTNSFETVFDDDLFLIRLILYQKKQSFTFRPCTNDFIVLNNKCRTYGLLSGKTSKKNRPRTIIKANIDIIGIICQLMKSSIQPMLMIDKFFDIDFKID